MMHARLLLSTSLLGLSTLLCGASIAAQPAPPRPDALTPARILSVMERVADWQLNNPGAGTPSDKATAGAAAGMMALANISAERKYRNAIRSMGERNAWSLGSRPDQAGDLGVGQAYAELYLQLREPAMLAPMRVQFDDILAHPQEASAESKMPREQDRRAWAEALFTAPPAWIRLYGATGNSRYLDYAMTKWWRTADELYDKREHLYFVDISGAKKQNLFTEPGNGLAMEALVRILQYLPANHFARGRFENQFKEIASRILSLQRSDGLWHTSLLGRANRAPPQSGASAQFTYALAWGVNTGLLHRAQFEPAARRGWNALLARVGPDGRLHKGGPTKVDDAGAFLLAASEMYRMAALAQYPAQSVSVSNPGGFHRSDETVELSAPRQPVLVMDAQTSRILPSQSIGDTLLFQANFAPGEQRRFLLLPAKALAAMPPVDVKTYARFVPERLDDFAWESDRIAHRVYGPAVLKDPKENVSSGVDVWLKSVRRPILDKWYKEGKYHIDKGEGVDNYHVGKTRGCGGLSVVNGGKLYNSSVYTGWKILANGPIRSEFELTYDHWDAGDRKISETKRISIDAGSNFSRVENLFLSDQSGPLAIGVGIVQRKGAGHLAKDKMVGWMSYWEPENAPNGNTACAVIVPGPVAEGLSEADNNFVVMGQAMPGLPFVHYLGAGWSKSGDFPTEESWTDYVRTYAARLATPLRVSGPALK